MVEDLVPKDIEHTAAIPKDLGKCPEFTERDHSKKQRCNDLDRVDADDETVRIATKSIRKELHRAVDDSVHSAAVKDARKQLLDKVLACSMRMVGLHDEVHKLGNEIRDRNVVVRDLQAKIDWNQYRINDEERQKRHNIEVRDRLTAELAEAEQLGRIKDKQIEETNAALKIQRDKNSKLQGIVQAAEKGNLAIRTTLENCRAQLSEALT